MKIAAKYFACTVSNRGRKKAVPRLWYPQDKRKKYIDGALVQIECESSKDDGRLTSEAHTSHASSVRAKTLVSRRCSVCKLEELPAFIPDAGNSHKWSYSDMEPMPISIKTTSYHDATPRLDPPVAHCPESMTWLLKASFSFAARMVRHNICLSRDGYGSHRYESCWR